MRLNLIWAVTASRGVVIFGHVRTYQKAMLVIDDLLEPGALRAETAAPFSAPLCRPDHVSLHGKDPRMNGFLSLLATYYLCGAALEMGPLPHDHELRCAVAAAAVGGIFLTPEELDVVTELGLAQWPIMHESLIRFGAWEETNEALVAEFEQVARTVALSMQ